MSSAAKTFLWISWRSSLARRCTPVVKTHMFSNNVGLMHMRMRRAFMKRALGLAGTLVIAVFVAACQKSSTGVLGPSGSKCAMSLPASLQALGADGGAGSLPITVAPECTWTASSAADWLVITSSTSGQGAGVVEYVASANPRASERRGALLVSERRVEVTQAAASCQIRLTPSSAVVSLSGGEGMVAVNATEGCDWSATSDAEWLSIVTAASGNGAGSLRFRTDANAGPARTGTIRVGNGTVTVQQHGTGAACAFAIDRSETVVPATGGADVVAVSAPANCPWTAQSHDSWIVVTAGANGSGNGSAVLTIAPNVGGQRHGTATIAGITHYVTQPAAVSVPACSYELDSAGDAVGFLGDTLEIGVTAGSSCGWTTSSQAPWITVVSGSGVGNGVAQLGVLSNTGNARTGTATIAGRTFTVTQQAVIPTCTYTLNSTSASIGAGGGSVQFGVTAGAGCPWTASTTASWITVQDAGGSGNGSVHLSIAANTGPSRIGTVMVAGRTFTVSQSGAAQVCTYALNPTQQQVGALGGSFSVQITTQAACNWTAASRDGWIHLTSSTTGTGSGLVQYSVDLGLLFSRSGEIEIAGQILRVNQAALLLDSNGQ
jgi:hypothetical protein